MNDNSRTDATETSISTYKKAQIRHRRRGQDPQWIEDLPELIDFSNPDKDERITTIASFVEKNKGQEFGGLLFGIALCPGLIYAPQALSKRVQMELAYQSVTTYCESPHRTNLDSNPTTASNSTAKWERWRSECSKQPLQKNKNQPRKKTQLDRLSWSTMGYHYDWTHRTYRDDWKSAIPPEVLTLTHKFAFAYDDYFHKIKFDPSAVIVNYYNESSVMGGHKDDLEYTFDKPVISMSMGLPGVFLLGGHSKQDSEPVHPILVRPGDVMILGGGCRLRYHGLARVLSQQVRFPPVSEKVRIASEAFQIESLDGGLSLPESHMDDLISFLSTHRININVRQVLPDGVDSIPETMQKHS